MLDGSILQKLQDAHQPEQTGKPALNFGVYYKNTLVALCHALEDAILTADYSPLMITAFQRGKWYLEEADRYGEIAEKSRQIAIMAAPESGFAEHPTSQKPNVALVNLTATDPVAQEWHLIILSPDYTAMVLCQELSESDYGASGQPEQDLERKFYGFWTFEPDLVLETAKLAIDHIQPYDPDLSQHLLNHWQEIADRAHSETAMCGTPTADHLGKIAALVVDYLQVSHLSEIPSHPSLDANLLSNELQAYLRVAQLIDQTDLSNPNAAAEVATLAEAMGQLLDLPAWQLHRLRLAGLLHRIAFLHNTETVLTGSTPRYQEQPSVPLTCSLLPGIQVLRRMPQLRAIATILSHQSEWWNGNGQPSGLAGDEIPVESRILSLVTDFQQRLSSRRNASATADAPSQDDLAQVLNECRSQQGERWDPKLVEALGLLVAAMQQGLSLSVVLPKIASGLWMLDSNEELLLAYEANLTHQP
ncbi:DICT sensory domain-containing protein [Egbenema bharatensis]|uniref:DICT sensory domain-containing protein n=1 Tax=Egbenema bharatensis TaxID=3463334 RepID=UPI003A850AFB